MPVCQIYMIEFTIQTNSESLISIPKTESESDETVRELFDVFSEIFRKFCLFFLKNWLIYFITSER